MHFGCFLNGVDSAVVCSRRAALVQGLLISSCQTRSLLRINAQAAEVNSQADLQEKQIPE